MIVARRLMQRGPTGRPCNHDPPSRLVRAGGRGGVQPPYAHAHQRTTGGVRRTMPNHHDHHDFGGDDINNQCANHACRLDVHHDGPCDDDQYGNDDDAAVDAFLAAINDLKHPDHVLVRRDDLDNLRSALDKWTERDHIVDVGPLFGAARSLVDHAINAAADSA